MKQSLGVMMLAVLLAGCSKPVDSKSDQVTYPLAMGNQWTYSFVWTWEHGDPVKTDTDRYTLDTVILTVTRADTIRAGVFTHTIRGIDVDFPTDEAECKYLNLPQGLYLVSKKYAGTKADVTMPRRAPNSPGTVVSRSLPHWFARVNWASSVVPDLAEPMACQGADPADTLPLVLAYPQHDGLYWTYHDSGSIWPYWVDKKIEGRETITTSAGSFECWRIRWIYGPPYSGIDLMDYVGAGGLVRRRYVSSSSAGRSVQTFDLISLVLH